MAAAKSPEAFRTISEVSAWLDTPAHVLRFWESRFSQVKPVKRAGGRRYYRPADMRLLGGIKRLLHEDGLTIRGVQKILREEGVKFVADLSPPLDDEDVIEGVAMEVEIVSDLPEEAPSNVIPMEPEAQSAPAPETAMLPGLEPEVTAPEAEEPPAEPTPPEPESSEAEVPMFHHEAPAEPPVSSPPAPEPEPRIPERASEPPTVEAPVAAEPEPEPSAPNPAATPSAADIPAAPAAPDPSKPRPLGTDLPQDDPADDDPAFAPTMPPLRTRLRAAPLRRVLAADRGPGQAALFRLKALAERMDAKGPDARN